MAGDDESKAKQIPAWQQQSSPTGAAAAQSPELPTTVHDAGGSPAQDVIGSELAPLSAGFSVDDIKRFLSDPGVRDAPTDKKISFLETKGVDREIIDTLLKEVASESFTPQGERLNVAEFKEQQAATAAASQPSSPPRPQDSAPPRDVPPVVTYPEFLVKPQKPPPLVTVSRLLNTVYAAGSLALFFYGTSEYLIKPMTATLTLARHDLATHSDSHIQDLNTRLEKIVSTIPPTKKSLAAATAPPTEHDDGDADPDDDDDPTELFHRDMGVQTSPSRSRRSSSSSSSLSASAPPPPPPSDPLAAVDRHATRLGSLRTHLQALLDSEGSGSEERGQLEGSVAGVRDYLNGLVYSPPYSYGYGGSEHVGASWNTETSTVAKDGKAADAVAQLRSEIRGVKGVLLSAKRFPPPAARVGA